jgi:uncharacterized protein DUF3644
MAKALPHATKENLEKCRSAAIAAVDAYNRPGPRFRTAHFIVLIVIAWTALFHAIFYKRHVKPWYKKKGTNPKGDRYLRIDGDPKHWDLIECLRQHYGSDNPPERTNLEFLIGLRNKIEHRQTPELDVGLYGECQAALLNLETMLSAQFGARYALAEQLAVSLQFSGLVPAEKRKAAGKLVTAAVKSIKEYVETFRAGLPSSTLNSNRYSFSVFLVPKVANRKQFADVAVEFIRVDEASTEELERLEKLNVLIKEKHIPIANLGLFRPGQVVAKVQEAIPFRFTMGSHTAAWRHFKIRPQTRSPKPESTVGQFCVHDPAHNDYLYTAAWIEHLSKQLVDAAKFQEITGTAARNK